MTRWLSPVISVSCSFIRASGRGLALGDRKPPLLAAFKFVPANHLLRLVLLKFHIIKVCLICGKEVEIGLF